MGGLRLTLRMGGNEQWREDPAMGMVLAAMGIGLAVAGGGTVDDVAMGIDLHLGRPPSKYRGNGKYLLLSWIYMRR
jgi:hypothetical protein